MKCTTNIFKLTEFICHIIMFTSNSIFDLTGYFLLKAITFVFWEEILNLYSLHIFFNKNTPLWNMYPVSWILRTSLTYKMILSFTWGHSCSPESKTQIHLWRTSSKEIIKCIREIQSEKPCLMPLFVFISSVSCLPVYTAAVVPWYKHLTALPRYKGKSLLINMLHNFILSMFQMPFQNQ